MELKRTKALARRTIKESKKKSWENYVTSINIDTPVKEVWNKINKIRGKKNSTQHPGYKRGNPNYNISQRNS